MCCVLCPFVSGRTFGLQAAMAGMDFLSEARALVNLH